MKALSSRLKKRAQAEYKQRIERLDNAIRSQSLWVQQQTTRRWEPVQVSGRLSKVNLSLTAAKCRRIRQGDNKFIR